MIDELEDFQVDPRARKVETADQFMSRGDVAAYIGVKSARSLSGLKLPPPDMLVGTHRGWKRETIVRWHANRPGRGRWGARHPGTTSKV